MTNAKVYTGQKTCSQGLPIHCHIARGFREAHSEMDNNKANGYQPF